MAHESFDDPDIAEILNRDFVCIKVDREERPDIDRVYMEVCMSMNDHGGWPLTALLDSEKRPWFCGTYFPPQPRRGQHGMTSLLPLLTDFWKNRREELLTSAEAILFELRKQHQNEKTSLGDSEERFALAVSQFEKRFDAHHGGFGTQPKFPSAFQFLFLLTQEQEVAATITDKTLEAMSLGGIQDHIGGGFHRYSTDRTWLLPHFEKMLYDQAFHLMAYAEASVYFQNQNFALTADKIVNYVLRDMTSPDGGFYSAEDADSEGEEGKFYVWSDKETLKILGEEDGKKWNELYQILPEGNFTEEHSGRHLGVNIPFLKKPLDLDEINLVQAMQIQLLTVRAERVRPSLDDKVLTDWNGLFSAALFRAGVRLQKKNWLGVAEKNIDFIWQHLRDATTGQLKKRLRKKEAGLTAHLDDYAFVLWALWEQLQSSHSLVALSRFETLLNKTVELFWEEENGVFSFSPPKSEILPLSKTDFYDGAIPSGNSVMAYLLSIYSKYSFEPSWAIKAQRLFEAVGAPYKTSPSHHAMLLLADFAKHTEAQEIVLVGLTKEEIVDWVMAIHETYHPQRIIWHYQKENISVKWPTYMQAIRVTGEPFALICENGVCLAPLRSKEALTSFLNSKNLKKS
jgi:hypothetical protein